MTGNFFVDIKIKVMRAIIGADLKNHFGVSHVRKSMRLEPSRSISHYISKALKSLEHDKWLAVVAITRKGVRYRRVFDEA